MKSLYSILILLLISAEVLAEPFTILAKSGINVREEPNLKSTKVAALPFGTVVDAEANYYFDKNGQGRYKYSSEVIEGKRGAWIKISFGKVEGYIFSGFGLVGNCVVASTEINREYRLMRIGSYCEAINYDPKLNWYALIKTKGRLAVKKSEVIIRLIHEFNEQDTLGVDNEYWASFPLVVQTNLKDTVLFLIGSKTNVSEGAIFSQFVANHQDFSLGEKFLYPEQKHNAYYEGKTYQFRAFEGVKLTKENPEGYVKRYQLELSVSVQQETKTYNLSKELALELPAAPHCAYKTPQLILVGDINQDGFLDFIYYSHSMTDSCGMCWEYHLFLSDKSDGYKPIKKVANQIGCNCI